MRRLKVVILYSGKSLYPLPFKPNPPRWTWGIYDDKKEGAILQAPYKGFKTRKSCVRSLNRVVNAIRHDQFCIYRGLDWNASTPGILTANIRYSADHLGWQIVLISANHRYAAISSAFTSSRSAPRAWWSMREDLIKHNFCKFEIGPKGEKQL